MDEVHPRNKSSKQAIWKHVKKFKSEGRILNINITREGPVAQEVYGVMETWYEFVSQSCKVRRNRIDKDRLNWVSLPAVSEE